MEDGEEVGEACIVDGVDDEATVEEDEEGEGFIAAAVGAEAEAEAELIMFTAEWTPPRKASNGLELVVL